jgi:hypothetical protein
MKMHEPMYFKRNSSRGGERSGRARNDAMWKAYRETGVKTPSLRRDARKTADGYIAVLNRKLAEYDGAFAAQALEMIANTPDRAALARRFDFLTDNSDSHEGMWAWATAASAARMLAVAE